MKMMLVALSVGLFGLACSPVEGEELMQDPAGISSADAGHTADGTACQACFYYSRTSGALQGCKTATAPCQSCSLLGCR